VTLRLFDTRARALETITPIRPGLLRVYACGPTVYKHSHVGNLRAFVLHDLLGRVAETIHGWRVHTVVNITDVGHLADDAAIDATGEDKIESAARREGKSAVELARFYEEAFHRDEAALNIRPAAAYPRASESIGLMIELVGRLIEAGHAYQAADGSIYYDAGSFASYGALSGNRLDELRPGHRVDAAELAAGKRFHADWALWKATDADRQLVWDSPWGKGFPGWHVECSAMSLRYLGEHIDVHTGGIDLRFPHHEDERAQSEGVVGHEVVAHWLHGEHLLAEGRKMAKSTGNVVLVSDIAGAGRDPLALRLFFLTGRYRQQMNLTADALAAADRRLSRWRSRVAEWATSPSAPIERGYRQRFEAALDDDLDTPSALVALGELEHDETVSPGAKFETFAYADRVLGLDLARDVGRPPSTAADLPDGAAALLDRRAAARRAKDYATSDALRDELTAIGVRVTDTRDGQHWSLGSRS
jgi:cysteinyl-tRNA synthetase